MSSRHGPIRLLVLFVTLILVAGACGGDDKNQEGSPTQTPTSAPPEQPVRGGTLVVGISADPGSLNPAVSSNGGIHEASEPMFNGLVALDNDGNTVGDLAESWTTEENGAVYRFKLRNGVKWHDGQPFTSADVKFTFENALLKFHSRTRGLTAVNVAVEAPDDQTVVFRFPQPYAPLLSQLNVTEAPIIPKHVYEACGADIDKAANCPPDKAPVGTGPFKFVSYDTTEIKMARNPDYYRSGQPYLDNLVERIIPDAGTRTLALQRQEVDWLWIPQASDLPGLRADRGNITLAESGRGPGGGNCVLTVAFNMRPPEGRPPVFTDLRVRQALWAATNRQQAAEQILFGQGKASTQPIHTAIAVARAQGITLPAFDVNRAKQLLDQAGWKDEGGGTRVARGVQGVSDGSPFKIDIQHFTSYPQADYAQVLKQQWKAVGVDVETKAMTPVDLPVSVFTNRTFDTATISYCNESDPQVGVRRQYHSTQIGSVAFSNAAGYSDPEMDALWDQSSRELDTAKRTQLFQRIQQLAVRDLPYLWMAETVNTRAFNARCTGFNIQNTGLFAEAAYCKR